MLPGEPLSCPAVFDPARQVQDLLPLTLPSSVHDGAPARGADRLGDGISPGRLTLALLVHRHPLGRAFPALILLNIGRVRDYFSTLPASLVQRMLGSWFVL